MDSRKADVRGKGGFTLVELIVVTVLLMILAGGLLFGINRWVQWARFRQQNEYARAIFAAAQNQLTEYERDGRIPSLAAAVEEAAGRDPRCIFPLDVETLRDGDGNFYTRESVWPNSQGKRDPGRYQGEIASVILTGEDYRAYVSDRDGAGELAAAIYDMVCPYLYDPSVLNANFCIEFAPSEAQVFSVWYSDSSDAFAYGSGADISGRQAEARMEQMTGYYGVDTLSRAGAPERKAADEE